MPGHNLNDKERSLLKFWSEPHKQFAQPLLKAIAIQGPPSLRGIESLYVSFDYPITAICGRNGAGKSTVLALAAFSSNRPTEWIIAPWATHPTRRQSKLTNYAWSDFFFRKPGDPSYDGLTVRFTFSHEGNDVEFERHRVNGQWRTKPDPGRSKPHPFPSRPIEFVSLSRILPPAELQYIRRQFRKDRETSRYELNTEMLKAMSAIFRQTYSSIEVEERNGARLARCKTETNYDGFNMGAGENAMISILSRLQVMPVGGLLIIEEIEHGLHPEAQRHLVRALTEIVLRNKQQIIFTTHSPYVIDSLPRQGRVLLQRNNMQHQSVMSPTTRFAMSDMTGTASPEATVYVEDDFSATLVSECLPPDIRRRIALIPIGSATKVATQLGAHLRGSYPGPAKCIFDGDCRDNDIKHWLQRENLNIDNTTFTCLPGRGLPPESWVLQELLKEPFLSKFAERIGYEIIESKTELQRLLALPDHHDVPYELADRLSKSEEVVVSDLISPLAFEHPELEKIRRAVKTMLEE